MNSSNKSPRLCSFPPWTVLNDNYYRERGIASRRYALSRRLNAASNVSARLLKYLLTCLPIRPNHSFDHYSNVRERRLLCYVWQCPYKLCSRVFQSRVFHPCKLVLRFPVLRFPPMRFGPTFSSPAFSSPAFSASPMSCPSNALYCFRQFLRATAGTAIARLSHRNSVRPSVCPSVRHTGGSGKNGAS